MYYFYILNLFSDVLNFRNFNSLIIYEVQEKCANLAVNLKAILLFIVNGSLHSFFFFCCVKFPKKISVIVFLLF